MTLLTWGLVWLIAAILIALVLGRFLQWADASYREMPEDDRTAVPD